MPRYSLVLTDEQDAALRIVATADGYADFQLWIQTKADAFIAPTLQAADDALVARARRLERLTDGEKTRVRTLLGL